MSFADPSQEEDHVDDEGPDDEDQVSLEERARAMGWRPLPADPANPRPDEFRGDPRRWTDPETFIRHGEETNPILREQNRRLSERVARSDRELERLRNTVAEQADAVKSAMDLARRADQRGYDRAKAELVQKRADAVETGDTVVFNQVQEQLDALEEGHREAASSPPPPPPPAAAPDKPPPPAEITQFIAENPWWNDRARPYLQNAMVGMHNAVIAEHPSMPLQDQLDLALDRMEAAYPEIVDGDPPLAREPAPAPRPRQRARGSVLTPSPPAPPRRPGADPFDRIADPDEKKEAKRSFESMKRQDPDFTPGEFMTIYENPHVDVLTLRQQRKK